MLLGLGSAERATAQTCLESTQTTTLSTDTAKKDKNKKPKRRAPRDGAGVQVIELGCGSDFTAPTVTINPGSGGQGSPLSVSIDWQDNVGLDQYAYWITLNGVDVTQSFTYSGATRFATSTGTVTLQPGNNTLTAEIWDQAGNWGYSEVTYSHTPPPPPSALIPAPASLPEATAGAKPSLREVVRGLYRQVLEREADPGGLNGWTENLQNGWTVKQMVRAFATSQEHYDVFVAGRPASVIAATMYRHLHGREAVQYELDSWIPRLDGGRASADAMVDGLLAETYYALTAGEHAVPGHPVSLWDARRASLVLEPRTGFADLERDLCLTVAVPGGAYECGDLCLSHALPAIRSLNKSRQPVLLYSSQHAHPMPIVAARVMLPTERGTPERVDAVLRVGSRWDPLVERARRGWTGAEWFVGRPRQIALTYDASADPTGAYYYALEVTATYPGGTTASWVQRGTMPVVNRRESTFGAGWWLAGVEQLVPADFGAMLWVGGDGSTHYYEALAGSPGTWVARMPDRAQDTLRAVSDYPGATHVRKLPGGARVYFDAQGRHIATVNRLDHHTHFGYDGPRLTAVHVPTAAGYYAFKPAYRFNYGAGGPNGRLYTVTAPDLNDTPGRQVVVGPHNGDSRVWTIQDPDGKYVELAYWEAGRPEVVNRRMDRRRASWGAHYFYGTGGRLEKVNMDMGVDGEGDDLITRFTPTETRGLVGAPVGPDSVYTTLNGPRTDVDDRTYFGLNRFGAPWHIVDAGRNQTILTRSDLRFPALVTRTDGPVRADGGRRTVSASYDARGNVEAQTDWATSRVLSDGTTAYATTRYERGNAAWPDFVTRTIGPEGESTRMDYHANGNRAWQQPGDDVSRRATFGYNGYGLAESIIPPAVDGVTGTEYYEYDGRGNLQASTTARGARTSFANDALGRRYRTESPIQGSAVQVEESTFYFNTDRVEYTRGMGPALNGIAAQTVTARTTYDETGNVLSVARRSDPDPNNIGWVTTEFRYDPAGRKVAEIAPDGQVDSTYYDFAGNAVRLRMRRHGQIGAYITMEYDALNRLTRRVTPEVRYAARNQGLPTRHQTANDPSENPTFPRYANDGGTGYLIPGDVATFGYDELGNMTSANNGDAQITRTYNPGGLLNTETQRIRTLNGADFSQHVYEVGHVYDLSGRTTEVKHPAQLAPSPAQASTRYAYDRVTGELATVTDALGNRYSYGYNARGETSSLKYPGGITESYGYDLDGNLLQHRVLNQSSSAYKSSEAYLRSTTFGYDNRGKILHTGNLYGSRDTLIASYSGLGHAVGGGVISHGWGHVPPCYNTDLRSKAGEQMRYDALGNMHQTATADTLWYRCGTQRRSANDRSWGYVQGTGRLAYTQNLYQRDTTYFDAAGNAEFETQSAYINYTSGAVLRDRASYYGADGKLRAADSRTLSDPSVAYGAMFSTTFEEYRYDALGRRVWVRARRYCEHDPQQNTAECNLDKVRRTVWDGERELYEIQMPGQDGSPHLENDTNPVVLPMDATGGGYAVDPNPFYGRTGYTYGLGVDRPLDMLRMGYGDQVDESNTVVAHRSLPAFAIMPLWSVRGQADLGVFADGGLRMCEVRSGRTRCVYNNWAGSWFANERPKLRRTWWHGSLVEDKKDAAGTFYRRHRYLDAQTGRFTQEDPIGLAGGLNAYGFANGDPVTYSDPFGLCKTLPDGSVDPECEARARRVREVTETVTRRVNQWNAAIRSGMNTGRDFSSGGHLNAMQNERVGLSRLLDALNRCDDDDDHTGTRQAAAAALEIPVMAGPARYPKKQDVPPVPAANAEAAANAAWWAAAATVTYWVVSEGSRLFLPRNLIPIP